MFLLTAVKTNQTPGSNSLALRLMQQVQGGGKPIGMQPISYAIQPVTLHRHQIFTLQRIRLERMFLP